jgi:hypothetical protein
MEANMKRTGIVILTLATLGVFCAAAAAQTLDYKVTVYGGVIKGSAADHFVILPEPMQLPDATLGAGTYIFKVVEPSVIQVTSTDRSIVYTTFFTAPAARPFETDDYSVTLLRRGSMTPLVTKMFLGKRVPGFEPIYSPEEARGER